MLNNLISRATLGNLAGNAAFQLGEQYFAAGAVGALSASQEDISARVKGTRTYRVELRIEDGALTGVCNCPRADDGYFCKHCVALGLAWLAENAVLPQPGPAKGRRRDPFADIRHYLSKLTPQALIDIVLDVTQRDDRLYRSLLLKADRSAGGTNLASTLRQAIDRATRIDDFIDWREAAAFADMLDQVVDSLDQLLTPTNCIMLVDLAEYAIVRIEDAMQEIDDSSGTTGEVLYRLGELHLKACVMAQADPAALAERLFRFETTLPFGVCDFDTVTYRDALGVDGLSHYRELAQSAWSKLIPRAATAKANHDPHRTAITRVMERLAEASGNVDELVAIKAMNLSYPYDYLRIATILADAGQPDKALAWAEKGMQAFPEQTDNRLRDFLVQAYLALQRNDEALQLTWIQFEEQGTLEHYKKLSDVAGQLGLWPAQRERALARVAAIIAQNAKETTLWKKGPSASNYSMRIAIALWENDLDAAFGLTHQGMCDSALLIELAARLESTRPGDAVGLYRRVVPPIVEQTNNRAYGDAIKLMRKIGMLMTRESPSEHPTGQFGIYLGELRMQYKQKRNFIKLLDELARSATR
jgi:tetratricopeptide (TPR) repeat protein